MNKLKLLILFIFVLAFYKLQAQDFRNVKWEDSPDDIKKKETAETLKDRTVVNGLETINFVHVTDTGVYFTYSYMFFENKLIGMKTQTAFLTKENTWFEAMKLYDKCRERYIAKYGKVHEQTVHKNLKKFSIVLKEERLFGEVKEEGGEFFLVETIMKNKTTKKR